ncbi:MAG: EpsG family protein [Ferruginibacter sp.]
MFFLTFIFIMLSLLVVLDFIKLKYKQVIFIFTGLFLFAVAAFRPPALDRDYNSYIRLFNMNLVLGQAFVEPSFILLSNIIHHYLFGNPAFLFAIYAGIAVTCKFIAIRQLSDYAFLSILIYFSYSFILHDITQIRAGVSVGFVLLAIRPLYQRQGFKFLFFALLAIFFHYSALLVLPLWFLAPGQINTRLYAAIIFISYGVFFFSDLVLTNIINYLPQGILLNKIASYESDNNTALNIFNSWQIMRCLLCFLFLWKIKIIQEQNPYSVLFLKIYVIATAAFVLLATNPTFAGRISDLFSIIDIVMLPSLLYIIKPAWVAVSVVILVCFLYLVLNVFYNRILV